MKLKITNCFLSVILTVSVLLPGRGDADALSAEVFVQTGHAGEIPSMAVSPEGQFLATSSFDGLAKLWDVASRREIYTIRGHHSLINAIAFSLDGRFLITAAAEPDRSILITDRASGKEVRRLQGHPAGVSVIALLPDGKRLLSAGEKGVVMLWDMEKGTLLQQWKLDVPWVTAGAIVPGGAWRY